MCSGAGSETGVPKAVVANMPFLILVNDSQELTSGTEP